VRRTTLANTTGDVGREEHGLDPLGPNDDPGVRIGGMSLTDTPHTLAGKVVTRMSMPPPVCETAGDTEPLSIRWVGKHGGSRR